MRATTFWPAALTALAVAIALAGCGATHPRTTTSRGATIVGVNVKAPGRSDGTANTVTVPAPSSVRGAALAEFREGEQVVGESGCLGCHVIGAAGNNGPGPELTHVGRELTRVQITRTLVNPTAPMPSFRGLPSPKLRALTAFLSDLR